MAVVDEPKRPQVVECLRSARCAYQSGKLEPPQHLRHLDRHEVRCMENLPGRQHDVGESLIGLPL